MKNNEYYSGLAETISDIDKDIYGNDISFDGNPNLKRFGTKLAYTSDHVELYLKCKEDWRFFAEHFYTILDLKQGMLIPKMRDYQIEMVESYIKRRFNIVLASRQCG
jgi:hypothetical protein